MKTCSYSMVKSKDDFFLITTAINYWLPTGFETWSSEWKPCERTLPSNSYLLPTCTFEALCTMSVLRSLYNRTLMVPHLQACKCVLARQTVTLKHYPDPRETEMWWPKMPVSDNLWMRLYNQLFFLFCTRDICKCPGRGIPPLWVLY